MGKNIKKKDMDKQLLASIFSFEKEWKQIQSIMDRSIDPTQDGYVQLAIAEAKYVYALREARHRRLSAIR
ncbi:YaaL family protein [Oceanobacillus bengalensis]|uniref:DUF2508 family protein n=1 Tax=Oceanobacillus bengalensis TaxID=1435466 RepID=A0A494YUD2_9BACI|nr:YaaL family protein [Oceanobacillus bengalensis]RKQ13752.1 DUF2508 family protein [Oceanobacillus bengalensis]